MASTWRIPGLGYVVTKPWWEHTSPEGCRVVGPLPNGLNKWLIHGGDPKYSLSGMILQVAGLEGDNVMSPKPGETLQYSVSFPCQDKCCFCRWLVSDIFSEYLHCSFYWDGSQIPGCSWQVIYSKMVVTVIVEYPRVLFNLFQHHSRDFTPCLKEGWLSNQETFSIVSLGRFGTNRDCSKPVNDLASNKTTCSD